MRRPTPPSAAALGTAVRELRASSRLSQEELAQRSGLHPTYLSGIESGQRNPTWRVLGRLAAGLGVRLSTLVERAERQRSGE